MTCSQQSTTVPFNAEAIKALVQRGKDLGLVKGPDVLNTIKKDGQPVPQTGAFRQQWIDVTPKLAEQWLANNKRNRTVSKDVVAAYARDMTNGDWTLTHQGIAFNDLDELIDGQHRLHAIILSGKTIRFVVTFGLPSKIEGRDMTTMDAVDRGRTRSVGDQLKIQHGMKNGTYIAGLCTGLGSLCFNKRTRRLSVGQTLDIYHAFKDAIDWMIANRSKTPGLKTRGVAVGFVFAYASCAGLAAESIRYMWQGLTGDGDIPPSIRQLREFLLSDDAKLLVRGHDRGLAELTLQAIYISQEQPDLQTEKLELSEDGANHYRNRQPDRVETIASIFRLPQ